MPDISVIMRTKDEAGGELFRTLEAVSRQKGLDFEVILIYSHLQEKSFSLLKKYPLLRIYSDKSIEPYSPARGLNFGISLSKGKYIAILNSDAKPTSNFWLKSLIDPLKSKNIAGVYGRQIPHKNVIPTVLKDYTLTFDKHPKIQKDNHWFSNVNSAIRREIWERRRFNENSVIAEDFEFGRWAIQNGYWLKYEPNASVWHSHNYSLKESYYRYYLEGKSLRYIFGKEISFLGFLARWLKIVLEDTIWFIRRRRFSGILYSPCYRFCEKYGFYQGTRNGADS